MNILRIGVIGTGLVFKYNHLPVLTQMSDKFKIVALCNRRAEKAQEIAKEQSLNVDIYTDHHKMLRRSDIDAVLVAVPIQFLSTITHDAISEKKHVFQEKPISENVKTGSQIIAFAKQKNIVFMVGENFRYRPEFTQLHQLVKTGLVGTPKLYRLNDLHYTYPGGQWSQTPWRIEGKHDGGYLIDGGTHIIAGMRETIKSNVILIHGLTTSFNPQLLSNQEDTLLLNLVFESGLVGQMALGYGTIDPDARKPKIYGTEGTLVLNAAKKVIELWPVAKNGQVQTFQINSANDFMLQWVDFYNAISVRKPMYSTPEDALLDLMILDAGRKSAKAGKVIRL